MTVESIKLLSDHILRHFGSHITKCELACNGVNKTFRCHGPSGGLYVRMAPAHLRTRHELQEEIRLLGDLSKRDLPVCSLPKFDVPLVFGPVYSDGSEYHGMITNAVQGRKLEVNPEDSATFARSLAKLHMGATRATWHRADPLGARSDYSMSRMRFSDIARGLLQFAEGVSKDISQVFVGLCHGDAWQGNALYDGKSAILFDFEDHHRRPIAYDVATQLWSLRASKADSDQKCSRAFLEEYQKQSGLELTGIELKQQIVLKELRNLAFLDRFVTFDQEIEDDIILRAEQTLNWVNEVNLFG